MKKLMFAIIGLALASCSMIPAQAPVALKDGELPIPASYKTWPKFLSEIQRPDARQVREIYVNPVGRRATIDKGFPNGTVLVMENYAAKAAADGTLMTGADGKLVKGDLLRVFVMGKDAGWGAGAPEGLKNGDWIYAAYLADGKASADNITTCRTCHLPLGNKDFVHRYDEYFQKRAGLPVSIRHLAVAMIRSQPAAANSTVSMSPADVWIASVVMGQQVQRRLPVPVALTILR